jgi:hypothetical protein
MKLGILRSRGFSFHGFAFLGGDVGIKASGLKLIGLSLSVRPLTEGPHLNLVEVIGLNQVGLEPSIRELGFQIESIAFLGVGPRLYPIQYGGSGFGLLRGWGSLLRGINTETLVDLTGDVGELTLQVRPRADSGIKPLVHSKISSLIAGEIDLLDTRIALADVYTQVDEGLQYLIANRPISPCGAVGYLDGNGPIVIVIVGASPGGVGLIHVLTNLGIIANPIGGTSLTRSGYENVTTGLGTQLAGHVVNGDLGDGVFATIVVVGRPDVNGRQRTTDCHCYLPPFSDRS